MTVDELVERLLEQPPWREVRVVMLEDDGDLADDPAVLEVDHVEETARHLAPRDSLGVPTDHPYPVVEIRVAPS